MPEITDAAGRSPDSPDGPRRPSIAARDVGVAALYALACTALWAGQASITDLSGVPVEGSRPVALLLLLLACGGIVARRARPGLMFVIAGGLGTLALILNGGIGGVLLQFEAVFSAVLYGSRRLARAVTTLCLAVTTGTILTTLLVSDLQPEWFGLSLQVLVVLVLPLLWAGELRQHRAARRQAERAAAAERELAARQVDLEQTRTALRLQEQRTQLAQDLHDGVTGHLSAVALQTGALRASAAHRADPEILDRSLEAVRASALEALSDMRTLIDVLRSDGETPADAEPASWTALEARVRSGIPRAQVRLDPAAAAALDRREVGAQALRIGQEAVTNVLKHAGPGHVELILSQDARGAVSLSVDSPLPASPRPDTGDGLGLSSMSRRAEATGARFTAGPDPRGELWCVRARWPAAGPSGDGADERVAAPAVESQERPS